MEAKRWLERTDRASVILDSGCGTGRSSVALARQHPEHAVIGIDQSARRLGVLQNSAQELPDNLLLVRAECADFWRLARADGWPLLAHYLLYPNPWPKPGQLKRRWHGHPVFPELLALPGHLVLRSNWRVYLDEFARAAALAGRASENVMPFSTHSPLTDFERKYQESGHPLYELQLPAEMSTG